MSIQCLHLIISVNRHKIEKRVSYFKRANHQTISHFDKIIQKKVLHVLIEGEKYDNGLSGLLGTIVPLTSAHGRPQGGVTTGKIFPTVDEKKIDNKQNEGFHAHFDVCLCRE